MQSAERRALNVWKACTLALIGKPHMPIRQRKIILALSLQFLSHDVIANVCRALRADSAMDQTLTLTSTRITLCCYQGRLATNSHKL